MHLLIPMAATASPACRQALAALELPQLHKLLAGLQVEAIERGDAHSLNPPHERARARAMGLDAPDGLLPFAALAARLAGLDDAARPQAWAFVTPCHWQVGQDHVGMDDPSSLALAGEESEALHRTMQPYFDEDGIRLHRWRTGSWLACSPLFAALPSASLDRVIGRDVDDWLPRSDAARLVRRLQTEMQMLLYTHAVNEAREQRRQTPVNSFWVSGSGQLPVGLKPAPDTLIEDRSLFRAARADDAAAWADAWRRLDAGPIAELLDRHRRGEAVQISLAGECGCASWVTPEAGMLSGLLARLRGWRRPRVAQVLESL